MRLLIVEDEVKVAEALRAGLTEEGFIVDLASCGTDAIDQIRMVAHDLIILDFMLPDIDGLEVLRRVRMEGVDTKVLMLTAVDHIPNKIAALNAGADDYLTKPFNYDELVARVHALLRRGRAESTDILRVEDLLLDRKKGTVTRAGVELRITPREFTLLEFLLLHKNEVVSRAMIAKSVWNYGFDAETNVIDVYINYLRRKIDAGADVPLIVTVRGRGYMIADPK